MKCPVCHEVSLGDNGFLGCEMLVDGRLVRVCGDCYREAYKRTNFKRIIGRPRKVFYS
jgi:hypothetical protein